MYSNIDMIYKYTISCTQVRNIHVRTAVFWPVPKPCTAGKTDKNKAALPEAAVHHT